MVTAAWMAATVATVTTTMSLSLERNLPLKLLRADRRRAAPWQSVWRTECSFAYVASSRTGCGFAFAARNRRLIKRDCRLIKRNRRLIKRDCRLIVNGLPRFLLAGLLVYSGAGPVDGGRTEIAPSASGSRIPRLHRDRAEIAPRLRAARTTQARGSWLKI